MSGASAVHMNVLRAQSRGGCSAPTNKTEKDAGRRSSRALINPASAVTEPNTGLNTTQLKTRAVRTATNTSATARKSGSHRPGGQQDILLARTTPLEEVRPDHAEPVFIPILIERAVAVHEIEKMGRKAVDSNELVLREFRNPAKDRRGEEGRGFEYILHA